MLAVFSNNANRNNRLLYLLRGFLKVLLPSHLYRRRLLARYLSSDHEERYYLHSRVEYYCRLDRAFGPTDAAPSIGSFLRARTCRKKTNYFLDLYEHLRHFRSDWKFNYRFGDDFSVPGHPCFVKARPISLHNRNAVLMKLNKVRHFNFVRDSMPFSEKINVLVWRGNATKPTRREIARKLFTHPLTDIGDTGKNSINVPWGRPYMRIEQQLHYKFILSIEGNDVATNLKWIMSSNSLCFMTRPSRETWFMEGRLIANYHYVLLNDDYSDLAEKIEYYTKHADQAEKIIRQAQTYVAQFCDPQREDLLALMVMEKYFSLAGQAPSNHADLTPSVLR